MTRQLPTQEPLVDIRTGKMSLTSSWKAIFENPGLSQSEVTQIVVDRLTTTINGLTVGSTNGIPLAPNSVTDAVIAPNTITEKHIVNGSLTGLSMALKTILVSGDTWTDNSPSADSVAWSSFQIAYSGKTTTIAAGSTSDTYIYWDGSSTTLTTSNNNPILGDNAFMIATNISGTHSIAYNKIAQQQIGAAWIQLASITDAQIASLSADKITAGSFRGINVQSSSFVTKGSYLSQATAGSDTTVNVDDTTDFPASGNAQIIGTANDRNTFAYTGKTDFTLTGCTGVLANNINSTVVPLIKAMAIDDNVNEMRFFGNRGDGTVIELASIGTTSGLGCIGVFGSVSAGTSINGLNALSNTGAGIACTSVTGPGLEAISAAGFGAILQSLSTTTGAALKLVMTTSGNVSINGGATYVPPIAAFYNFVDVTTQVGKGAVVFEIYASGAWQSPGTCASGTQNQYMLNGTFYCDGTNMRLHNLDGGTHVVSFQRM